LGSDEFKKRLLLAAEAAATMIPQELLQELQQKYFRALY
jgi:hypothetical protein